MFEELKKLDELIQFRSLMGLSVSQEDTRKIWGKKFFKSLDAEYHKTLKENLNINVDNKLEIAKKNLQKILIFNWVKFVGVSGSVGAGFAKEDDDIDLFIVVRNSTMWLYRGILSLWNIFHGQIRTKAHKNVKDKFCINLISEERDLYFENDIFNFHELMYVKPIYNEKYLEYIYSKNDWLQKEYKVKSEMLRTRVVEQKRASFLLIFLNYCAFLLQLLFMLLFRHSPEVGRLKENFKNGKIEFFPMEYRESALKNYLKTFKSIN
ncbi:MAG: nucleotidyltransferase domain-containing protein [Candidatus Dojkabacteria bacterium]